FSAHAEVFPLKETRVVTHRTLLRARGGISNLMGSHNVAGHSSPRTRRYFPLKSEPIAPSTLFSAHAEVFPGLHGLNVTWLSLLRARGGISYITRTIFEQQHSSPRTRRYFLHHSHYL